VSYSFEMLFTSINGIGILYLNTAIILREERFIEDFRVFVVRRIRDFF